MSDQYSQKSHGSLSIPLVVASLALIFGGCATTAPLPHVTRSEAADAFYYSYVASYLAIVTYSPENGGGTVFDELTSTYTLDHFDASQIIELESDYQTLTGIAIAENDGYRCAFNLTGGAVSTLEFWMGEIREADGYVQVPVTANGIDYVLFVSLNEIVQAL